MQSTKRRHIVKKSGKITLLVVLTAVLALLVCSCSLSDFSLNTAIDHTNNDRNDAQDSMEGTIQSDAQDSAEGTLQGDDRVNAVLTEYDDKKLEIVGELGKTLLSEIYKEDENIIISPLSVLYAMSMTANGAENNTLSQMEDVLYGGHSVQEQNAYLRALTEAFDKNTNNTLDIANSIWIRDEQDRLSVEQSFLQSCVDYYDSQVFKAPFDNSTVTDINDWIKQNTNGKIDKMVDSISEDSIMYLLNTLYFDGEWMTQYMDDSVEEGVFTAYDNERKNVKMMTSTESRYIEDGRARGFVKYYARSEYAFIAMLPNEGITLGEYIKDLDMAMLLASPNTEYDPNVSVTATMPQFEYDCTIDLVGAFKALGITDAFDNNKADFSKLIQCDRVYISRIDHKCTISLDQRGTCASAASVVAMAPSSAPFDPPEPKVVTLDRPFFYMIVECATLTPIFVGTVVDFE